ncbi:cytochrome c oxidase subunit II [Gimesia maris]|uniref:cytochrome c oxidase subunit II n=1 Tax=Gimesia maris TaxID=122 RepID=UPI00241EDD74|nr:cytochrome c oxidase subunit II [Gimesia maris]
MGKGWCLFFLFWPVAAVVSCAAAPLIGWSFPYDNAQAASNLGIRIDSLFYLILAITALVFVGTQAVLVYALWRSANNRDERAQYIHGNHKLELIWSIIPGAILLFLALYQMNLWADFRFKNHYPEAAVKDPLAEVTARQFEWRFRYPAIGKQLQSKPQPDDLYTVNELHVPFGKPVLIQLRSDDVQHSFFLPALRIKQDALPGLQIPVWFEANKPGVYDLVCAELCGWGHYKMKAHVIVQPEAEYQAYLKNLTQQQSYDGLGKIAANENGSESEAAE